MKDSWIKAFNEISRIVIAVDPADLISEGAPLDEYEIEALDIFCQIKTRGITRENLVQQLLIIFMKRFSGEIDLDEEKINYNNAI